VRSDTVGGVGAKSSGTSTRPVADVDAVVERHVVVGDRGRLVLPAAVRAELGLREGSRLLLSTEPDGSLRLRPYRAVADGGRGLLAGLGSGSLVDELIAERRAAASAEDAG
jgi:AbrB family looped-hinge helix DNA binding protein